MTDEGPAIRGPLRNTVLRAEYALSRIRFPQDRIEYQYHGSGHVMYVLDQ